MDGGVFANNPGGRAVSVAAGAGRDVQNIALLSVGTGGRVARYPFEKLRLTPPPMGILPWVWPKASKRHGAPAVPLLAALFDAMSASDRLVCEGFLGDRYHRVQVPLRNCWRWTTWARSRSSRTRSGRS